MFGWNVCETELLTQWTICLSHESDFLDWCICVETLWQTIIRNERWNFERQYDRLNFPFQFHTEVDGTKWQTCETVLCWCAAGASSSFTIPQSTKTQDPHQKQAAETRSRKTWVTFLAVYRFDFKHKCYHCSIWSWQERRQECRHCHLFTRCWLTWAVCRKASVRRTIQNWFWPTLWHLLVNKSLC